MLCIVETLMDSSKQIKRKRGRPRKNVERDETKIEPKRDKKDENIVLFLALSDEDTSDSEDNRFTVNDSDPKNGDAIDSLSDSDLGSKSDSESDTDEIFNMGNKQLDMKTLIEEIKKRDAIIEHLRNKGGSVLSSYNTTKPNNIHYHCVQVASSDNGKIFEPAFTDCECWWCDHEFDNLPVYLVNYYRGGIYYVFGNFCSFNCALKYNVKMLKDFKCETRRALTLGLRSKVTGETGPCKFAKDREMLKKKGGKMSIDKFREGFTFISIDMKMSMPPMIPLMHVIEEGKRD